MCLFYKNYVDEVFMLNDINDMISKKEYQNYYNLSIGVKNKT